MSSVSSPSSASVRNILTLLASRNAQLVAGADGIERSVTWACRMRARLPAFESIQGGELALLTLSQVRRLNETLPHLLTSLDNAGVAAVAVATQETLDEESLVYADRTHLPLIVLPSSLLLEEIEREVITFVVGFRGEVERKAVELSQHLMQLGAQGVGMEGMCEQLALDLGSWVVVQDAEMRIRVQVVANQENGSSLPQTLTDEALKQHGLARVIEPILIRHEIVGYLSLIGDERTFNYSARFILERVVMVLALEFVRERERVEVESRYHVEAFTDVIQGHYQQDDEMLTRARLLGYDLTLPQVVVVVELPVDHMRQDVDATQWNRRVRDEFIRSWPTSWVLSDVSRVTALLPVSSEFVERDGDENGIVIRIERMHDYLRRGSIRTPNYSFGIGRIAKTIHDIPQSFREAQRALEIGRQLFGEGQVHAFSRLGIYRLLFHLDGQSELTAFYHEMLGSLLEHDTRHEGSSYIETLEEFFHYNGNLSEMARATHFHRNSLIYRLKRIEEILGRSLEDPETRLSLQIALKIHSLRHYPNAS